MRINQSKFKYMTGFSLIELVVVITIIAVLMSVGVISYRRAGIVARNGKRRADVEAVRQALVLYRSDNAVYPGNDVGANDDFESLLEVLRPDYLGIDGVEDPKHVSPYVYHYASDGRTFNVCYWVEPNGTPYCLTNP